MKQKLKQKYAKKFNETQSWYFEKIKNIDKPLAKLIKRKKNRILFNKIKLEMKREILQQKLEKFREVYEFKNL